MEPVPIRPMRWWDIASVLALEHELFADDPWSERMFWSELAQTNTRYYAVATETDEPAAAVIGYVGGAVIGDCGHVHTLGVRSDHQRHGVGAVLLRDLLAEIERRGHKRVLLEVRADNDVARALYERHGFRAIGLRKRYYQPSGVDAVVMERE